MSSPDREKEREMLKQIDRFNQKQKTHAQKVERIVREISKFDDTKLNRIIRQIESIKDN